MRQSMRKIFPKISFSKDPYNNRRQYITYMANGYREILFYDCMDLYRFHNICDEAHDIHFHEPFSRELEPYKNDIYI